MCAELVPAKKGKAPAAPAPVMPKPANDAPTPDTLTSWTRDSEFYAFLYQLLLRNKLPFKPQAKAVDSFIGTVTKLHAKALAREFSAAPAVAGGAPEKFKVIELAEKNAHLESEIQGLRSQIAQLTALPPGSNGTLKGSVKK